MSIHGAPTLISVSLVLLVASTFGAFWKDQMFWRSGRSQSSGAGESKAQDMNYFIPRVLDFCLIARGDSGQRVHIVVVNSSACGFCRFHGP